MIYTDNNLILELINGKGTLFHKGKLIFKGFGYVAIQEYIKLGGASGPFENQLRMREECRFKTQNREREAE